MEAPRYSPHAVQRLQQRGMRENDIDLVLACGTQVADDSFLLTERDVHRELRRRKREIQALERLCGVKVVVRQGVVVTCFRATREQIKKLLSRVH